jgi:hypothetical protein
VRSVKSSSVKKYTVETTAHTLLFSTPELLPGAVWIAEVDLDGGIVRIVGIEDDRADFPEIIGIEEEFFW